MRRKILTLIGIATGISCLISVTQLIRVLNSEYLYRKDFTQFFLMGHALRDGANLYAPFTDLAAKYDPHLTGWLKVSAYPPIAAVVGLPFSFVPYFWSLITWMGFELACLTAAVVLIVRHFGGRSASTPVLVTICAFIGWQPLYIEIYQGQVMLPILLLLTLCWLALKEGKDVRAGIFLGIVIAIKLYAWPIALFLLLKRRWQPVVIAGSVFIAANALMLGVVGSATLVDYYFRVGRDVLAEFQFYPLNFSAWCVGLRSFGTPGAVLFSVSVLLWSLFLALRSRDFDAAFMVMLTASTILQPISWIHYLLTLLPAFCFVANRRDLRTSDVLFGIFLLILIMPGAHHVYHSSYAYLAEWPMFLFVVGLMWLIVPKAARVPAVSNLASETA